MFSPDNKQQMEESFKEFAKRPENKALLERHQQEEIAAALQLQEHMQELTLQQEVSRLQLADQKLLAPVLRSPVLRQLLVAMSNPAQLGVHQVDAQAGSGLEGWLANPRVLKLLREAAKALKKGLLTEDQLAKLLQQEAKAQQLDDGVSDPQPTAPHQAQLPSHLLVEALNEHLSERRAGNTAYQQQQYDVALRHYQRALSVTNFVVGQSPHDQAEVEHNKATVLLNMAAVHMALKEWGTAVHYCDEALLTRLPDDTAVKAWLRRGKANLGRHEYEEALSDLCRARELDAYDDEVAALTVKVLAAQRQTKRTVDKQLAARMLRL